MRFLALACDYDGTLAHHGRVEASTIAAWKECAQSGRKLLLVTGRELDDLRSVFAEVDLFDGVVAENGALLYDPGTQREQARSASRRPQRSSRRCAAATCPGLGRPRHRRDLGAARDDRARGHPRPRPRAAGDLQQGRGDGAAGGRQQGDGPRRGARASSACRRTTSSASATPRTTTPSWPSASARSRSPTRCRRSRSAPTW